MNMSGYGMSETPPKPKRNHKLRKKLLIIFARSLDVVGWISFLYFLWEVPNMVGVVLGLMLIFASIVLEVVAE